MEKVNEILANFESISLKQITHVSLMNRVDTKFIGPSDTLPDILKELKSDYKILEIHKCRVFPYKTEYFDTKKYKMYEDHQNGKLNRYKVRKREYVLVNQHFLEVKFKNNKGRTIKSRIQRKHANNEFTNNEQEFLKDNSPFKGIELEVKLYNQFNRITLVGENKRITIDFDLIFKDLSGITISFPEIFILEIKQEKINHSSKVHKVLKEYKIRSQSFSKYCMGTASLNDNVKSNMLKQKFNLIKKIKADADN